MLLQKGIALQVSLPIDGNADMVALPGDVSTRG